ALGPDDRGLLALCEERAFGLQPRLRCRDKPDAEVTLDRGAPESDDGLDKDLQEDALDLERAVLGAVLRGQHHEARGLELAAKKLGDPLGRIALAAGLRGSVAKAALWTPHRLELCLASWNGITTMTWRWFPPGIGFSRPASGGLTLTSTRAHPV